MGAVAGSCTLGPWPMVAACCAAGIYESGDAEEKVLMEQEEAGQPPRRLVGIDLGIASRHAVRVLEAGGQVVCRSSCVPAVESLAAAQRAALAGAPGSTTPAGGCRAAAPRGVAR